MSFSDVSAEQREQQQADLKKFLALSFLASAVLHGVALPLSLNLVKAAELTEEPIEFIVVEEPKTIEEKVVPPPETKPEPVAETPPEPETKPEPVAETPPEPETKPEPVAETPPEPETKPEPVVETPPEVKPEPVAETLPPVPQPEPAVTETPLPAFKEESPVAETPPLEQTPPIAPKEFFDDPKPADTATDAPIWEPSAPETKEDPKPTPDMPSEPDRSSAPPIEQPPPVEPPVTATRPGGNNNAGDFLPDVGKPDTSDTSSRGSGEFEEPSNQPLDAGAMGRSPSSDSPVTATRPGGGSNSGDSFGDLGNPGASEIPGGGDVLTSEGGNGDGEIPSSDAFGSGSGAMERQPSSDSPVTASRPGAGGGSGDGFGDLANPDSFGTPGGNGSGSSGDGSGDGTGSSSGPFGDGSGAMPRSANPGGSRGSSGGSGSGAVTCRSCGKPSYPNKARREGREGQVEVRFDVDPDGKAFNVEIVSSSGHEDFDSSAVETVQNWEFSSSESGDRGKTASIKFRLND